MFSVLISLGFAYSIFFIYLLHLYSCGWIYCWVFELHGSNFYPHVRDPIAKWMFRFSLNILQTSSRRWYNSIHYSGLVALVSGLSAASPPVVLSHFPSLPFLLWVIQWWLHLLLPLNTFFSEQVPFSRQYQCRIQSQHRDLLLIQLADD